ncbi:amidohydrolase [Parapedobacter sp. ISTM3]|uniref:Aminobenzoyl-glutamate utilization protein B n=1 Tax=Parapedobacter luteus TaxID=623280 RepID=A0A1T5D864_9SPHI|nr:MULTISPECIES: amidohydrolase [Parapedobacter]MBK1438551.1 amidohydrolase [Parapedobacter sp. ISTM3]SKB67894.1 aminobenzoyl-glutamate utilization protein B [Parapedobacter luteus]
MIKKQTFIVLILLPFALFGQNTTDIPLSYLDRSFQTYDQIQKAIWSTPELGFLEKESSGILQNHLEEQGFAVEAGLAGMPTSFIATYGSGSPVIGILAEFDALPGISQDTVPYRKPITEGGNGHACGHNVFGTASVAGAVAIKEWLASTGHQGTIKVFGTPAEEGGGGKVYLVRDGFFKGIDVVLDWHPATRNAVNVATGTAIQMVDYTFHGKAAHAAASPDKGRSALDGVEALNYMVNLLREHIPSESRIHYVITNGGEAPNVVPEVAKVSYYIRHPKREVLQDLVSWVNEAAEGAAKGTQTTVSSEIIAGFYEKLPNRRLAAIVQKNLETVGGIHYDSRERAFAEAIVKDLGLNSAALDDVAKVQPLEEEKPSQGGGSSDVGDVSWNVPTVSFGTATFVPGSAGHSWQNVASGGTTIGTKSLINTAKVFALTAIDLYTKPTLINEVKEEFESRRGANFRYESLLGDRAPALDYRLKNN